MVDSQEESYDTEKGKARDEAQPKIGSLTFFKKEINKEMEIGKDEHPSGYSEKESQREGKTEWIGDGW